MHFIIASDTESYLVQHIASYLIKYNHTVDILPCGPWGKIAKEASLRIVQQKADQAIVLCYTGTGVCIAANKVHGIRAALCIDAQTSAGAKKWNNANVLALSLRLLSPFLINEILESWLNNVYDGTEDESLKFC